MRFYHFKVFISAFTLLIFSSVKTYAQKNESVVIKTDTLGEVSVIKNKKQTENRSTTPLQQMNSDVFTKLNTLQVSDALKYFSGVTVKDFGGVGGLKTVSVRGFGANHTSVSYDGIKVSDMQTGQIDIGKFSIENVDYISLNNGQSDNIFQSASLFASASLLNIKTLQSKFENGKNLNAKIGIKYGSYGFFSPSLLINKKISGKHSVSFNGEWISAKGNYPFRLDKKIEGNDDLKWRKNSDVKNLHLETTFYSVFSDKQNGYFKASYYDSERGLPGAVISYNPTSSAERLWNKNFFSQAHYFAKLNSKIDFQANAKYSYDFTRYLDSQTLDTLGKKENTYAQQEIYGSVTALYKPTQNLSFSISSDLIFNRLNASLSDFAYPNRLSSLTVLAGKLVTDRMNLTASLLYTNTNDDAKKGYALENQQKLSPYAGLSIQPFDKIDLRFRAFYKNVFRLPTFNDLYYNNFGSRTLKPEDANQFNIGTTYSFSNNWMKCFSITADAYHNEVKNKIVAFPNSNLFIWTMKNDGKVEINGIDVNLWCNFNLKDSINLTITNSFTYQYAVDKTNPDNGTFNNQLPYTPRYSGGSSAILDLNFVSVSYSLIWSGKRYAGFENLALNKLNGYTDHNLSVSKTFNLKSVKIETALQALNITNHNYQIVRNYPMQGRTFRINLSVRM